ncbi:MAG: hypothetical protein ACI81V_000467 [Lentimonas sp.]|jgi:hypothetical protein
MKLFFDLAVQGVAAKILIVLHLLNAIWLLLFVAAGHVAGNRLTFSAGFCAFDHYVLSWHN